jgi:hypothetical protein
VNPWQLAARLLLALLLGLVVASVYRLTNAGNVVPSFRATLVLLTILIAAVTQVIGDNVARAFSLVGALSIVRFRTVVQDTRDTAFVIFAVTVGMAVGADNLWVAGLSLLIVGGAAAIVAPRLKRIGEKPVPYQLAITVAIGYRADDVAAAVFQQYAAKLSVMEVTTASRGSALETKYELWLNPDADPSKVAEALNDLEGVQNVQLRRVADP